MFKKSLAVLAALGMFFLLVPTAFAKAPYRTYERTERYDDLASPDLFVPGRRFVASQSGTADFSTPEDFCFDREGNLYVADAGNKRIAVFDSEFRFLYEIKDLKFPDGRSETLNNPTDVFVTEGGEIYIADPGAGRIVATDRDGTVRRLYTKPDDKVFTASAFQPAKIGVDRNGTVYAVCTNVFQGILLFDAEGNFDGYYGSPPVSVSFRLLADRFWKSVMTHDQRSVMSNYVPVEYSDLYVHDDGFVYACVKYIENYREQIRKLNYLGNNVLEYKLNFGEDAILDYKRERWFTKFLSLSVGNDFIYALDSQWQRVYVFDSAGRRLGVFGTYSDQAGAFLNAASVQVFDDRVYVLDKTKASLTEFTRTEYGDLIFEAVRLHNAGKYEDAVSVWQRAGAMSVNNLLAYTGMGEAKLMAGDYKEAVRLFRLGENRQRESAAFLGYRAEVLRNNIGIVAAAVLILAAGAVLLTSRAFWKRVRPAGERVGRVRSEALRAAAFVAKSPVVAYNELKIRRFSDPKLSAGILALWFAVTALKREFYGFRFNIHERDEFSLLILLALTVIPFLLFVTANWAVCAVTDGEGKFGEILTFTALALVPYILFTALSVPLSNVLTLSEQALLNVFNAVGIFWSLILLFHSQRTVHNFSGGKTLGAAFLTVCGVAVILVIALLFFSLVQQVVAFVRSVASEIAFRR